MDLEPSRIECERSPLTANKAVNDWRAQRGWSAKIRSWYTRISTRPSSSPLPSGGSLPSFFASRYPIPRFASIPLPFPPANGKRCRTAGRGKRDASEPRKLEIAAKLHRHVACRVTEIIFVVLSPCCEERRTGRGLVDGQVNNSERTR